MIALRRAALVAAAVLSTSLTACKYRIESRAAQLEYPAATAAQRFLPASTQALLRGDEFYVAIRATVDTRNGTFDPCGRGLADALNVERASLVIAISFRPDGPRVPVYSISKEGGASCTQNNLAYDLTPIVRILPGSTFYIDTQFQTSTQNEVRIVPVLQAGAAFTSFFTAGAPLLVSLAGLGSDARATTLSQALDRAVSGKYQNDSTVAALTSSELQRGPGRARITLVARNMNSPRDTPQTIGELIIEWQPWLSAFTTLVDSTTGLPDYSQSDVTQRIRVWSAAHNAVVSVPARSLVSLNSGDDLDEQLRSFDAGSAQTLCNRARAQLDRNFSLNRFDTLFILWSLYRESPHARRLGAEGAIDRSNCFGTLERAWIRRLNLPRPDILEAGTPRVLRPGG